MERVQSHEYHNAIPTSIWLDALLLSMQEFKKKKKKIERSTDSSWCLMFSA